MATRNRADRLRATLGSLESVTPPSGGWELIVVDNGSTDATADVLADFTRRARLPLLILTETRPGKPVALNAGLARARAEILAFTDDDCIIPADWLTIMDAEFRADPLLGGLGGRVELYNKSDRPVATRTDRERSVLASPQRLYEFVIGCNMAFTRPVIEDLGGFDPLVGPGAPIGSGNDVDLVYRAFRKGYRVAYVPGLVVYHNHGRESDAEEAVLRERYLRGRGGFYAKFALRGDLGVIRMALSEVREALSGLMHRGDAGTAEREAQRLNWLGRGAWTRLRLSLFR